MSTPNILNKVKDYLGRRFLLQYGAPAYWVRPQEDILINGDKSRYLSDGSQFYPENLRIAKTYPFMEFDTSYYTRFNKAPPVEYPRSVQEPKFIYPDIEILPHLPVGAIQRDPAVAAEAVAVFCKTGYMSGGYAFAMQRGEDYIRFGQDSDYLYFHD